MSNYSSSQFTNDPNTPWTKVFNAIPAKAKVLDVGCSSGNFGEVLVKEKQCIVDGIEPYAPDAELASKKLRHVYVENIEGSSLDFLKDKYDVINFGDVLEHLVEPVKVLQKVRKYLSPNGVVMFSIPNMAHMSVRLMLLEGRFEHGDTGLLDKTHLHFYDKTEVEHIFGEAGYKLTKLDYAKRDIPKDVVRARLHKLGIEASDKYLKSTKSVEASAYQFVGIAKPSEHKLKLRRPSPSPPINDFEKHIDYMKTVHQAQIDDHKKRIKELESQNGSLQAEVNGLKHQLDYYDRHLFIRGLRRAKRIIKRK